MKLIMRDAAFEKDEGTCQTCGGTKEIPDHDKGTYHIYNWLNKANVPSPMKPCPDCTIEGSPDPLTLAGLTKLLYPDYKPTGGRP